MVQQQLDTPDWQGGAVVVANNIPTPIRYSLSGLSSVTLVAGTSGKSIIIYYAVFDLFDASGNVIAIEDTSGNTYFLYGCHNVRVVPINYNGCKLPVGAGIKAVNLGATAMTQQDGVVFVLGLA